MGDVAVSTGSRAVGFRLFPAQRERSCYAWQRSATTAAPFHLHQLEQKIESRPLSSIQAEFVISQTAVKGSDWLNTDEN
jgi:hypothetical protein